MEFQETDFRNVTSLSFTVMYPKRKGMYDLTQCSNGMYTILFLFIMLMYCVAIQYYVDRHSTSSVSCELEL